MNQNMTTLIVDDSESIRLVLGTTLRNAGINVVEAANGEEALQQAKKQQFDFIITDINMPEMDGLKLIKALRELVSYRFTPILTLTNLNSDRVKEELRAIGATGWLQKPFGPASLLKTIERVAA